MTIVSILTQADVDALKCIFFQLVKTLKEVGWYGLDCNIQELEQNLDLGFTYLQIINTNCEKTHPMDCEIKSFIKRLKSHCIFTSLACTEKTIIEELEILLTESDDPILTEDNQTILI